MPSLLCQHASLLCQHASSLLGLGQIQALHRLWIEGASGSGEDCSFSIPAILEIETC